jgi:hypothetical protein
VFDREGRGCRRKAPENLFQETDFYTIPRRGRDLILEHGLQELEDHYAKIRDQKIAAEQPVTAEEGAYLFAFMIAMSFRTRAHRERRRREWHRVVAAMEEAQQIKDSADDLPPYDSAQALIPTRRAYPSTT